MNKKRIRDDSQSLVSLFECQVVQKPEAIAIVCGKQSLSYEELNQRAYLLACHLYELGVKRDSPVAICMPRSAEYLIVVLGILKAGGACVPLDLYNPEERLLTILNDDKIPLLITTSDIEAKFSHYEGKICIFNPKLENLKKSPLKAIVLPDQLAFIIYTSGSTGKPKGVLIEHKSLVNYSKWFADTLDLRSQERIDFSSNPAFDFALTTSIISLALGLTIVVCEDKIKKDPDLYIDYLQSNKINLIKLTPGYFQVLQQQAKMKSSPLDYLEKIVLGGERLLSKYCVSWLSLYPSQILFNEYGPTETTIAVCIKRIDQKNRFQLGTNAPIGTVDPKCKYYIMDKEGQPVVKGDIGELWLGGICLARGYLNQPSLTSQKFIKDPFSSVPHARLYKTGDQCRLLPNSELEYIGRIDDQIKVRGFRIEPAEIEDVFVQHPALESVRVSAVEDHQHEKRLIAYYILTNKKITIPEVKFRQYLKNYLPDYMIPTFFIAMESFPLNTNDKLDRNELPIPDSISQGAYEKPDNPLEKTIAKIWANEFGLNAIGVNDDFFDIGGHSLAAARIISTITQTLAKKISIQQFYQNPTIRSLSNLLDKLEKIRPRDNFPKKIYQRNFQLPLSDFQFTLWLAKIFEPKANKINICTRKRFQGHLDEKKLLQACHLILNKHEVLSYQISNYVPLQQSNEKKLKFQIEVKNLESLSQKESEQRLEQSLNDLSVYQLWPKDYALCKACLFYLKGEKTELQLCIPHMISDEISLEILFSDLSKFYLSNEVKEVELDKKYREYLFSENQYIKAHLENDLLFWQDYLKEAFLFSLPQRYIVSNMKKHNYSYSSYLEIPENLLDNLRAFCSKEHFSLDNGLCGILLLALSRFDELNKNTAICINKVKSTRDNSKYDSTIGCFLNLELIKIKLNKDQNLNLLCQGLSESIIKTHPYQGCSSLVKLANIGNFRKQSKIKKIAVNFLVAFYNLFFPSSKINKTIINHSVRLNTKKGTYFLINVNFYNNFLNKEEINKPLFGCLRESVPDKRSDLLAIDNLLDICFLRGEDQKPYIVVSANLTPEFQELLRSQILEIFKSI